MSDFVFLGPSLPVAQAREILPDAAYLPPVQHGDLLRIRAGRGDRVLVIDGLFMMTAPVRHREILDLLADGVTVAGSSSMGALRAAELWPYGMRGVGDVFELYRSGVVEGDDEVAVVHGPAEEEHRLLSEPLVNIRLSLADAAVAGAITSAEGAALLDLARSLPFRARSVRGLRRTATGDLAEVAQRYAAWASEHPRDAKAEDARTLLRMAAADDPRLCPAGPDDRPLENMGNHLLEAWRTRHRGDEAGDRFVPEVRVVTALLAFHPDSPALHRDHVLRELASAGPEVPADRVDAIVLDRLADKGLLDPEAISISGWLSGAERAEPLASQALTMAVRMFGTVFAKPFSDDVLPPALRNDAVRDEARRYVAAALRAANALPHPDPRRPHLRLHFKDEAVDRMLCRIWDCAPEDLYRYAADRGFADLHLLREAVEPHVAWMKFWGPPMFEARPAALLQPVG